MFSHSVYKSLFCREKQKQVSEERGILRLYSCRLSPTEPPTPLWCLSFGLKGGLLIPKKKNPVRTDCQSKTYSRKGPPRSQRLCLSEDRLGGVVRRSEPFYMVIVCCVDPEDDTILSNRRIVHGP